MAIAQAAMFIRGLFAGASRAKGAASVLGPTGNIAKDVKRLIKGNSATGGEASGGSDRTQKALNSFWLLESGLRFSEGFLPQVDSMIGVIVVGFPDSSNNNLYNFAMAIAAGLQNKSIQGISSNKFISVDINHTDKIIKLELGFTCSGLGDQLFAESGQNLINAPIAEPIVGGYWPGWLVSNTRPPIISVPGQQLTGVTMLMDTPNTNSSLLYGNGMYGQSDILMDNEALNDAGQPLISPPTSKTIIQVTDMLLGIN